MTITLHEGDNRDHLRRLIDEGVRVHAIVTDPPYGLTSVVKRFGKEGSAAAKHAKDGSFARLSGGFMGKAWDGTGIERDPEFWKLCHDVLLPGGYCFAFSGSRTGHWQACAMEMAGFVMHPMHGWVFGSGFPKATNAARSIDKASRGVLGKADPESRNHGKFKGGCSDENRRGQGFGAGPGQFMDEMGDGGRYEAQTPEAAAWDGWAYGTQAQKPALEPIFLGQRPFDERTGAANLLKHGVGAVNIDATRVPYSDSSTSLGSSRSNPEDSRACTCCAHEASRSAHSEGTRNPASASSGRGDLGFLPPNVSAHAPQSTGPQGSRDDYPTCRHSDDEPAHPPEAGAQEFVRQQGDGHTSHDRCARCGHSRGDHSKPLDYYTTRHVESKGRHPANLLHDGSPEVVAMFPDSDGQLARASTSERSKTENVYGLGMKRESNGGEPRGDSGSAARFFNCFPPDADPIFYQSKAGRADRAGSKHPTVKPVALLQHLIRHITPPGGVVLDPFAGSGTTAEAARREGFDCILMEAEEEYAAFIRGRFGLDGQHDAGPLFKGAAE